jgi:plastocyanin
MRRGFVVGVAVVLLASGCAGGASDVRTVRVDFRHDEFASHYWRYFPGTVYAHPGDELVFDQQWTGEPHTVTFGTIVDESVPKVEALEKRFESDEPETDEAIATFMEEYEEAGAELPVFDAYLDLANADAVRPCYLESGVPPQGVRLDHTARREPGRPCPKRDQPEFDGTQSFYSSGFIPPSGVSGNTYRVPLADDIDPGTYLFYCVIHFPDMQGKLVVKAPDDEIPSASEVNAQARKEIDALAEPLRDAFADARAGRAKAPSGETIELPVAGYHSGEEYTVAVDEFVPKVLNAKVDEPVTWTITGAHTVSFDVPSYVPIYREANDGTIERNPVVDRAAGGSPKAPPVDFVKGPVEIDGGTWDGEGFISSGLLGAEPTARYTLRVSKAGRYKYACLVHPPMVGTLVVEE